MNNEKNEIVSIGEIVPRSPSWLWKSYIARNGINLIVGPKGVGKSSFACWLAAQASLGTAAFGGGPVRVFIDSLEDDPEIVLRPRIEAAGGDLALIETRRPGTPGWKFPRDIGPLVAYLEERQRQGAAVALIVLDSLAAYVPRFATPQETDQTLENLTQVCQRFGLAMVFIHHFNKTGRTIDSAIGGASAITRVARCIHLLGREAPLIEPLGKDDADSPDLVLACHKLNIAVKPPALRFMATTVEIPTVENVHRLELAGESPLTAEALFAGLRAPAADAERETEVDAAVEWLLHHLVEGPRPVRKMLAEASADGFSKRTIERARAKLKIEAIHPKQLAHVLGEDVYAALAAEEKGAWWVSLPTLPDALPEEWS